MNNKYLKAIGFIIAVMVISYVTSMWFGGTGKIGGTESLKDRIIKAGKIRVGYVIYPPSSIKDPNTGKLSGIFVDALDEAGKNLNLKVDWTEEVGWGSMIEGLRAGRYDMIGSPVWTSAPRATQADFSIPLMYSAIAVYARPDDHRFDKSYDPINDPNVRIAAVDGELSNTIAKEQFPQAKIVSLPQLASISEALLNVATGKADVAFVEISIAGEYLKNNPGKIRNVQPANPLRINGNTMVVPEGEQSFKSMLDVALQEELNSGFFAALVKKYETIPGSFYPPARTFDLPK